MLRKCTGACVRSPRRRTRVTWSCSSRAGSCTAMSLPRMLHTQANVERARVRYHRRLSQLTLREEAEEAVRDFLPMPPVVPPGWAVTHSDGTACFTVHKDVSLRGGDERLCAAARLQRKLYESTYNEDTGERNEQEYLNFALFVTKPARCEGGIELALTSIDMELVVDALTVHATKAQLHTAQRAVMLAQDCSADTWSYKTHTRTLLRRVRDGFYRGPMVNELDDDLVDAIRGYLDERGVHNVFAEFMMAQAHYYEQYEYLGWLKKIRRFAE